LRCKNCPNEFETTVKTRNRKYCDICKFIILKIQKRNWKRKRVGRYGIDLKCLDCGIFLGNLKNDRKYCDECNIKRVKISHHNSYLKRKQRLINN
jgi:hypothetical protein